MASTQAEGLFAPCACAIEAIAGGAVPGNGAAMGEPLHDRGVSVECG